MVQIGQLDLYNCSETIETHSLSGYRRLEETGSTNFAGTTLLAKYANRGISHKNLSLYEFFFATKAKPDIARKKYIPHFVGASSTPVYPITESYALSMLILHRPWSLPLPFSRQTSITDFINISHSFHFMCSFHSNVLKLGDYITIWTMNTQTLKTMTLVHPLLLILFQKISMK